MSQSKLIDYSAPVSAHPDQQKWDCWNCHNKQDIVVLQGRQMVRCFGNLKPFRQGCPSWSDGKDLEYMLQFAAAKKGTEEGAH